MSTADSPAPAGSPSSQELKAALKAFRKRLRLTRLEDESRIAGGPLSGGRSSGIVAIQPPAGHAAQVWDELVRQGKLKKAGHGMYERSRNEKGALTALPSGPAGTPRQHLPIIPQHDRRHPLLQPVQAL